jgi:hypothetical protein
MFPYKNNVLPNENAVSISGKYENDSLLWYYTLIKQQ